MLSRGFQWFAWLAYLTGSLLILMNSIEDYHSGGIGLFIFQKGENGENPVWRMSLYIHILAGLLCLSAALPQFSKHLLHSYPAIHRISGRVYGMSVPFLDTLELGFSSECLPLLDARSGVGK